MSGVRRILVIIIFLAIFTISTGVVAAADWNVSAGSSIQTVINSASENDTILVNDNNGTAYTYTENVVINKKINLQAASDLVTIQSLNSSKPVLTVSSMGSGSTIQDFIITGATSSTGIYLNSANNCLITGNDLTGNYNGIQLYKSANNTITDNTISNNNNIGMYIYTNSNNNYIQNNDLTSNPYGIYITNSINNQIIANTINNSTSYAIYLNNANSTIIDQNILTNNNYGIYLYNAQNNTLTENTATHSTRIGIYVNTNSNNNNIQNNTLNTNQYGINTYNSQNNTITGNYILNTTYYGIYLYNCTQTTINLNTIDCSNSTGIYLNTGSNSNYIQNNFLTSNPYGIYIINTINNQIIANTINNSTSYAIYLNNANTTIIDQNNINNNNYGIYLYNAQNNTLTENTVSNNTRIGVYVNTNSNNNNIQNNILTGNQYGIYSYYNLNNLLSGNIINNSTSYAIYLNNVNNTNITQNNLTSNNYGIYLYNAQNNTLTQNTLSNNTRIGIYVNTNSNNNNIHENILTSNQYGINTYNSQNNTIIGNSIFNTTYYGIYLSNSTQSLITQNTINNSTNTGIYLNTNSNNNYILNNILTSNSYGIIIRNSLNNLLLGNEVSNSTSYAFYLNNVNNTSIDQNNVTNNNYGIYLYNSQNNTLIQNTLSNNTRIGIYVNNNSNNNNIQNNTLNTNQYGINTYNSQNNTLIGNSIFNTTYYGIYLSNSTQSIITQNTINNSTNTGIYLNTNSTGNNIQNNIVSGNRFGIYLNSNSNDNYILNNILTLNQYGTYSYITQNNIITSNTINNNTYDGIYLYNSSALINFNRIAVNGRYGLYKAGSGTVIAVDNWWGSNTPKISSAVGSDIYMPGGIVTYDPWLVLNTTVNPPVANGHSIITVDLNHNNRGDDTSSSGSVPDGIPVNFTTDLGTITNISYTRNGRANATFNRDSATSGTANITSSLDKESIYTSITIDATAPTVTVNLPSGIYNTSQYVILNATDDLDPHPIIYYTLDGSDPTTSSIRYTDPIHIVTINTILKFMAVDQAGNQAPVQIENYNLNVSVININTGNTYSKIQDAINDPSTLNGDTIEINSGIYVEAVVINKKLTLRSAPGTTVTVQTTDPNDPYSYPDESNVFTITSTGSGSTIHGLNINGGSTGIYLDFTDNCHITGNNISNNIIGIYLNSSFNNTILDNNVTYNYDYGIYSINSPENTLRDNMLVENWYNLGILGNNISEYMQDIDTSNTINGNPIYYLVCQDGLNFNGTTMGYLSLISCNNIRIADVYITDNSPILIINSNNSTIENSDLSDYETAIYLRNSSNITIYEINIAGINLESSHNNTISINNVSRGIFLLNSTYNLISDNNISNGNGYASFANNINSCIYLESSSNNIIQHNYLSGGGGGPVARALSMNQANIYIESLDTGSTGLYLKNSCNNTINENNLDGSYRYGIGLFSEASSHNTISQNNISNYSHGIYLRTSLNNTIIGNTIYNNSNGFYIENSSENTLRTNLISENEFNFGISGNNTTDYTQDIDTSNTINGKPIYYLVGQNRLIFDGTPMGYLALILCDGIEVRNVTITNNDHGLLLVSTTNSTIENCNLTDFSQTGICIINSTNNTFSMNNIYATSYNSTYYDYFSALYLEQSSNNSIFRNNITSYYYYYKNRGINHGIYLISSSNNQISENFLSNNDGISLESSSDNNIIKNMVSESILLSFSNNNYVNSNILLKLVLLSSSNNILSQNNVSNNRGNIGIYLESSNNNAILDNNIAGDADKPIYENIYNYQDTKGIVLNSSFANLISGNNVSGQQHAIYVDNSGNNQIEKNHITCNVFNFDYILGTGFWEPSSYGISITGLSYNNTIYLNNIANNAYGIYFHIVSNNIVTFNNIISSGVGILFEGSSENRISGNTISNGTYGIYFSPFWSGLGCNNNIISNNYILDNNHIGIRVHSSSGNIFNENIIINNPSGIKLEISPNNNISGNTINNNYGSVGTSITGLVSGFGIGLYLDASSNNIISGNTINNSTVGGIYVDELSNSNTISENVITNCGNNISINIIGYDVNYNCINGIFIGGHNTTISGNTVNFNGINTYVGVSAPHTIVGDGRHGILVTTNDAIILGNTANSNGIDGINVHGNNIKILQNTASHNGNNGIDGYGINYIISGNTLSQNLGYGINIAGINSTILENNVTNNGNNGINANGANTTITWNNATSNSGSGIYVNGADITVSDNTATNNQYGIYLSNSTGTIQSNDLADNQYGIYLSSSSANINFNRIAGNSLYGIYITGNGVINATNNWWGTNNPIVSSSSPTDIYMAGGTVTYNPWLVLNINTNPVTTTNNSTITIDLTHNNAGSDTSPQGHVPDNIPISFLTSLGNITNPGYTRNGKTNATFSRENVSSGTANITVTLDNQSLQTNVFFDETPLAIHVNPIGGLYNRTQNVTLITIDPNGTSITYYTTDGSDPQVNGIVYSNLITINTTSTLRYVAVDSEGICGPLYTTNYIIDTTPPNVTADIQGGVYNSTQTVNLTATDNIDSNPVIYFTTDGSDPTTSSTLYTSPITLQMNFTTRTIIDLKFMSVDHLGNKGQVQIETYILTLPVVNINNNKTYSLIQDAINDNSTLNGDIIQIYSGTYSETVIVTKKLTIMPASNNNVTIQAADSNHNVFTITNSGNGSIIQGLTLIGYINLQANDCKIYMNTITGNGTGGIITSNSVYNAIIYNDITCNGFNGIQTNSSSNTIYGNTIHGCVSGIYSENSNNTISSNDLTNNFYGIWTYNSTDAIHFNRIAQNTYGLRNDIGTVNATNNWWGTNNPINPNDIWNVSGDVNYTQWLVLGVNVSSTNSGGNSTVTADLTRNNQGEDTTPYGHVPNGIPVNFTTNYGTIIGTSYTVKGRATTILNLGSTENATVTAAASLDNQNISTTGFISIGTAILTITSTAIDNSTGLPLNTTYAIPLNNSVTWLSVVWVNTGMFTDELQIIVDGIVVQDRYFNNTAYTTWQNSYSASVFNAIIYVNQYLPFIGSAELTDFWNNLTATYNLTSTELEFIQNHGQEFMDNLTVNIVYPGVAGLNLTVTDSHSNVIDLNFPGNVVQRTSQVIYSGSLGEGVKSYAIATTKVTNDVMQYWWDQYSSYQTGDIMNVAYNTFLTALMVEYVHDRIADNISTTFNVTWSRTSPVIVSVGEDPYQIYETLESDHSMGMTVIGTTKNMIAFNFINSNSISIIEYVVISSAYNETFSSVTLDLIYLYNNYNTYVESFQENGFIIMKSLMNDNFLVLDLETGILRDIDTVNNFCGGIGKFGNHTITVSTNMIGCITWMGFRFWHWQVSNPWDLGTYQFVWNGKGRVYLSGDGSFLADIGADNILTITGPHGTKTVRGTQAAIDITDILDKDGGPQILQLILLDTDLGFIGTSPLYLVQKYIDIGNQHNILPEIPIPINDETTDTIKKIIDDITNFFNDTNRDRMRDAINTSIETSRWGIKPTNNVSNDTHDFEYYNPLNYNLGDLAMNYTGNSIIDWVQKTLMNPPSLR